MNTFEHDPLCPCYGVHPWDEDPPECACEGLYCRIHDLFNCWFDHRSVDDPEGEEPININLSDSAMFGNISIGDGDLLILDMNDGSAPRRYRVLDTGQLTPPREPTADDFAIDLDAVTAIAAWSNIDAEEIMENMRQAGLACWSRGSSVEEQGRADRALVDSQPLRPVGEFIEACDSLLNDMYTSRPEDGVEYDASGLPIERNK